MKCRLASQGTTRKPSSSRKSPSTIAMMMKLWRIEHFAVFQTIEHLAVFQTIDININQSNASLSLCEIYLLLSRQHLLLNGCLFNLLGLFLNFLLKVRSFLLKAQLIISLFLFFYYVPLCLRHFHIHIC